VRNYVQWHDAYDDPGSDLSRRLRVVQDHLRDRLDATEGPIRVLSLCSGDGRDILGVLAERTDRDRVSGVLVELHEEVATRASQRIDELGLADRFEVKTADAGLTDSFVGAVPADIVLLMGIFGNIHPPQIKALIDTVPQLARPGALVLWSRGRSVPGGGDLTSEVAGWVRGAGCTEIAITAPADAQFVVGAAEFRGATEPLRTGRELFTFFR
jgi:cyclopropane fatty-acyl-phospholipid synthase-like methyltransferase